MARDVGISSDLAGKRRERSLTDQTLKLYLYRNLAVKHSINIYKYITYFTFSSFITSF